MSSRIFTLLLSLSTLLFIQSCTSKSPKLSNEIQSSYFDKQDSAVQTGGVKLIPIQTPEGTFNVWTKRIGNNPTMKVLILHGGPGGTHEGYECFESFLPKENIEFIYYDQLASGNSDNPKDSSLYDLSRYVEEVEQVRQALKLDKSNFYLYGHSWGGLLAMQYALKYQENIKGLIISDMMASCPQYGKYADEVLSKQMPPSVLDTIRRLEKAGDFENPKYMELLLTHFYAKHVIRLANWPEPVTRMFSKLNKDLYTIMQGPSEFGVAGKLKNWDLSKELKLITVPTLVIGATYDTMDPAYLEWMSKQFPKGEFLLCKNGSHLCLYDDQETYFTGLIKFIKSVN
ncbi:MAG: proline iminopeptidase-family hydrolase [Chitinophagales bacterium]|nr:proline iminopeptidase-family hydrolase [Chitinophagales bacterium]